MNAIRRIVTGGKYVSPAIAEKLVEGIQKDGNGPIHETLSDREYEVMKMIAAGKRLTDIANDLSLSVKTIGTYRERILEKMGLTSNAEITRYALSNHLIE